MYVKQQLLQLSDSVLGVKCCHFACRGTSGNSGFSIITATVPSVHGVPQVVAIRERQLVTDGMRRGQVVGGRTIAIRNEDGAGEGDAGHRADQMQILIVYNGRKQTHCVR